VHHRHGSDQTFDVQVPVAGREVLLIDDTFTSGAEVQSAASALHLRGAYVTAVVVIGRYLDLDLATASARSGTAPASTHSTSPAAASATGLGNRLPQQPTTAM
jgi:orotate phosphoribosyltransferase